MSPLLITILMFAIMLLVVATGQRLAFVLGGIALIFATFLWGEGALQLAYSSVWRILSFPMLVAIPLFLFTGIVLERSGLADDLFESIYRWLGAIKGGLAMGTVFICVIIAAIVGTAGAGTVMMGITALPPMLKRGYNKLICTGTIQAGGALGFLIPPSVIMIIYSMIARVSIGKMFIAGIFPGILLAGLYIVYIGIRCKIQPTLGPAIPKNMRFTWREKFTSLKAVILPGALITVVFSLIMLGITSIIEAASIAATGSIIIAAVHRRLNIGLLKTTLHRTLGGTAMVFWVLVGGLLFSSVYDGLGSREVITDIMASVGGKWGTLIVIQLSFFVMGMFLDDTALLLITAPVYLPLIKFLGFDPVWFGVLYILNMQMAYLTPPFGYCLFWMRAVSPPEITLGDIYKSIVPFVAIQAVGLCIVIIFPQIALWLPNLVFGS
jgi:tripartite ATP-independent transporter DctM subunit